MTKLNELKVFLKQNNHKILFNTESDNDSFYIVDLIKLKKDYKKFENTFSKYKTKIAYSYKTNYLKPLITELDTNGAYSEVVSPFEVEIAETYGIKKSKLIYNGPVKDKQSINAVLEGGLVNADSFDDLDLIIKSVKDTDLNYSPSIGVRLSFNEENLKSRFGIEFNDTNIKKVFNKLSEIKIDAPTCLHIHFPERDLNSFKNRVFKICKTFSELKEDFPIRNCCIDIGGGLPSEIPNEIAKSLNIKPFPKLDNYGKILEEQREKFNLTKNTFFIEPGTALVSNSLFLVGNIFSINKKKVILILILILQETYLGDKAKCRVPTRNNRTSK